MIKLKHFVDLDKKICFDRDDFIIDYVKGKSVLHIGCVDSGRTREKYEKGELLHLKMLKVARKLHGIDIDCDGINYLKAKGINNLDCLDISKQDIKLDQYDVIVLGEVLEHLSNPGEILQSVAKLSEDYSSEILITVPNAFALFRFKKLFENVERVHEDHVAYYSQHTIKVALERYGLIILKKYGYIRLSDKSNIKRLIKKLVFSLFSSRLRAFSDGLIVVSKYNL